MQLNYCFCVQEARNYLPLHFIADSNTGGFTQYFKIVGHLFDPTVRVQGLQLYQTMGSINIVKIYLYWLNCPRAVRGYETIGRVRMESKGSHREAQSAPTLLVPTTGLVLERFCVWIQRVCRKERRWLLVSFFTSFNILLVRKKEKIDLQHPDFLQTAGSQWQCPFSLSLSCCDEDDQRSLHVC